MKTLVVNGPNLNLLGEREPEIYGAQSLDEVMQWLRDHPDCGACEFKFFQSNHEGALIDFLHEHRSWADATVINPGGLTHTSVSLRDAIAGCQVPAVEIHLSDVHAREEFRQVSMIKDVCIAQISGKGKDGYVEAVRVLQQRLSQ